MTLRSRATPGDGDGSSTAETSRTSRTVSSRPKLRLRRIGRDGFDDVAPALNAEIDGLAHRAIAVAESDARGISPDDSHAQIHQRWLPHCVLVAGPNPRRRELHRAA